MQQNAEVVSCGGDFLMHGKNIYTKIISCCGDFMFNKLNEVVSRSSDFLINIDFN